MSTYKIIDTSYDRDTFGIFLTQIAHAQIVRSGETKTVILKVELRRNTKERWGASYGHVYLLEYNIEGVGLVSVGSEEMVREVPPPKDRRADHRLALEKVAASLFDRAIRVLTTE